MKRSITHLGMTLGSAALIALGAGCSRESRPAQAPPAGTTSPTFESNVPTTPAPGHEQPAPGPEMGAPPPPPPPGAAAPPPPPPQGEMNAPAPPSTPTEQPSVAIGTENDRQMCDALAGAAILHVEDVQNGAAIVIAPKPGHDLASVRDEARRVETTMRQRVGTEATPAPATSCGLFSITQLPGVTPQLIEGAKRVRIVVTTPNPAEVKDLRRITRDQISHLSKAHPSGVPLTWRFP